MSENTVKAGQIWADNDPRCEGRTVRVERVEYSARMGREVAICTVLTNSYDTQWRVDNRREWDRTQDRRGAQTQIAVRRMRPTSTGWRLLQDTPEATS